MPNSTPPRRARLDSSARQADTLVEGSSRGLGSTFKLIATKQIMLWKALLFSVFIAGFASALTFVAMNDYSTKSEAAANNQCNRSSFNMAFILIADREADLTSQRITKLDRIKTVFAKDFFLATSQLATMDTSAPVVTMVKDASLSSLERVTQKFYRTHPDAYDFLSIYQVAGVFPDLQTSHAVVKNDIAGIGLPAYDNSKIYGSKGKLLGINFIRDIDIEMAGTSGNLLHETGHQWCCYAGDNFAAGAGTPKPELEIKHEYIHFFSGLHTPFGDGHMGERHWVPNGDGTFRMQKSGLSTSYHPFHLYFMGLFTRKNYARKNYDFGKTFPIYYAPSEMEIRATPYGAVSVDDIIRVEGERRCVEPKPGGPLPTGSMVVD